MIKITDIRNKSKSKSGPNLIDIRTQIADVYFSYLREYKDPAKKDEAVVPESKTPDELWEYADKMSSETLNDFVERMKYRNRELTLDKLYEMSENANIMVKTSIDLFKSDHDGYLTNYDFSQVSSKSDFCYLAADVIDANKERELISKVKSIEAYKSSFIDKKLDKLIKNILLLKEKNEVLNDDLDAVKSELDSLNESSDYSYELRLKQSEIELEIRYNETVITANKSDILKSYLSDQKNRTATSLVSNKLHYAIKKASEDALTGTQKLDRLVDIGSKTDLIEMGEPVILVVETIGIPNDTEFKIKIKQKEDGGPIAKDQAYKFLDGDNEVDEFVFKVANQELDSSRKVRKVTTFNYPSRYRGYVIAYDETTNYQNKIPENSKSVTNDVGEKIIIQRSLVQFSARKKDEEANKKLEDEIKKMTDQLTPIYLEVIYPDTTIKIKGTDLTGKTSGKYFGISKALSLGLIDLELLPEHNFLSNNKEKLELAIVDGALVWKTVAIAFLKMKAAAKKEDINVAINSGYRPAFGKNSKVMSSKGNEIQVFTQESLRSDKSRWVKAVRDKYSSDHDFIMSAGASAYNPATAPPGKSEHGAGLALDLNTGSWAQKKFSKLDEKEYIWLINNSFNYGFVRTVPTEEWHFEYHRHADGPYYKLKGTNDNLFYKSLKLDEGSINLNKTKGQMDYVKE